MGEKVREEVSNVSSNISVIRDFFLKGKRGRKIEMSELRELSLDDREELGELARRALLEEV